MTTITRQEFLNHFSGGVALSQSDSSLLDLAQFDTNQDGVLQGSELQRLFQGLDQFDRDGSPQSIELSGRVGAIFRTLRIGRLDPLNQGSAIIRAARWRMQTMAQDYGITGVPTSPHPQLSQNHRPEHTRLSWLRGQWKCNQFVGDVLSQAGLRMPVHPMKDGSVHYMQAEALPYQRRYFNRVDRLDQLRAGDLVVVDWPKHGAGTAHTEIFSKVNMCRGGIHSIGAHAHGVTEERGWQPIGDWHEALHRAAFNEHLGGWTLNQYTIYLLRPISGRQ